MKPHLPLAILACLLAATNVFATTWSEPVDEILVEDGILKLKNNIIYTPNQQSEDGEDWASVTINGGETLLTGRGTVSAKDTYTYHNPITGEEVTANDAGDFTINMEDGGDFTIDSSVKLKNWILTDYSKGIDNLGTTVIKGTLSGCEIDLYRADLREATLIKNTCLNLYGGSSVMVNNLTVCKDNVRFLEVEGNTLGETGPISTIHGNLILKGGLPTIEEGVLASTEMSPYSGVRFYAPSAGEESVGEDATAAQWGTVAVSGSLTISAPTTIELYNNEEAAFVRPDNDHALFICDTVKESQLSNMHPYEAYDEEFDEDGCYRTLIQKSDSHFVAATGEGGKVYIYLTDGALPDNPDEPTESIIVPAGETVVLGQDEATTPNVNHPVFISKDGIADASLLADDVLNSTIITGEGGELQTNDGQTLSLNGTCAVRYSVTPKDTENAAKLNIGGTDETSSVALRGRQYKVSTTTVSKALATIGRNTTLEAPEMLITDEGKVTNFGKIKSKIAVKGEGSSLLNQGSIRGNVGVGNGAVLTNNGAMLGNLVIGSGAKAYGSGSFGKTVVKDGGLLHVGNSPGYQQHQSLSLHDGATLSFSVDGFTPASPAAGGAGTHSYMQVETLTLSGAPIFAVEVSRDFALQALANGKTTITLIDFEKGNGTDATELTYEVNNMTGGLMEDSSVQFDGNALTFTCTLSDAAIAEMEKNYGSQVANTMWATLNALESYTDIATEHLNVGEVGKTTVWGSALGSFGHYSGENGFCYNGSGYAVGAQRVFTEHFSSGVSFGQTFGSVKAEDNTLKSDQRGIMPALTARYIGTTRNGETPVVTAYAAYGDVQNTATVTDIQHGSAKWHDKAVTLGVKADYAIQVNDEVELIPFIGLRYTHVSQDNITLDMSRYTRSYSGGSMHKLSLPVGITARGSYETAAGSLFLPELTLMFEGDVSRDTPSVTCETFGIKSRAEGSDPGRCAFRLHTGANYIFRNGIGVGAFYTLELRDDVVNHNCNAGITISF